ncbi:MAG: PQQ-binding-like beta-propeller repeat protein [Gemmatimonadaceae bacterium]|nr:PQQ-binding-like beta-propeller repeat protein [Gemmatimonadaceae bacterium]
MLLRSLVVLVLSGTAITLPAQGTTCPAPSARAAGASWARWGADVRNTRAVPRGAVQIDRAALERLQFKWAVSLGDVMNARSQPAVFAGTVYVGSESGHLRAIDAESGCVRWTMANGAPVRSGIVVAPLGADTLVWFGDVAGHVHAVDARTGTKRWTRRVDAHMAAIITGTPQLHANTLYVPVSSYEVVLPLQPAYACCSFRGSVVAVDAGTGTVRWQSFTIADTARATASGATGVTARGPSGAAVWSTPTIDEARGRLYVGTGNNYSEPTTSTSDAILAMELATGRIVWSRQYTANDAYHLGCDVPGKPKCPASDGPDADFGQPPILQQLDGGRRVLVVGQKSGMVHALDPDRDGAPLWSVRAGGGGKLGGAHWGSAADARTVYVPIGGQEMTPVADSTRPEGFRLDPIPTKGGGLVALDLATGRERWRAAPASCAGRSRCTPAQSAPATVAGDVVVSGAVDGVLRAYDVRDGRVRWTFDTVRDFTPVNGGRGRGGALDVAGPVIVGRILYVMSGYGQYGGLPGNVLLAFEVRETTRR